MKKGRPCQSDIRQNILEILHFMGQGYGYQISKIYNGVFAKVSQRSIYYHLRKGVSLGELNLNKVEVEEGNFSWGKTAEKIYYSLGKKAKTKGEIRVKEFLDKNKPVQSSSSKKGVEISSSSSGSSLS